MGSEMCIRDRNIVCMANVIRSKLSARLAETTLYLIQTEDHILNRPFNLPVKTASEAVLRHPNMNDTGRMPGVALLHVGMKVRLTVTIEAPHFVIDSTGIIQGIDLDQADQLGAGQREPSIPVSYTHLTLPTILRV